MRAVESLGRFAFLDLSGECGFSELASSFPFSSSSTVESEDD